MSGGDRWNICCRYYSPYNLYGAFVWNWPNYYGLHSSISEYMCSPVCFKLTAKYKICCLDGEMRLGIGKSSVKHTSFPLSMSICDVQATSKQSSYLRNTKRQHLSIVCARCVCVPDRFEIRADERWDDLITTTIIHFTHLPSQCRQISFGLWMKTLVARLNCYF